jgi:molybdopterin-binding protein
LKVYARLIFTGIIKELRRGRMLVNAEVKIVIIAGDIMKNSGRASRMVSRDDI